MNDFRSQSPLAHVAAPEDLCVVLREIAERGMIDLRGLPGDRKFMAAAKEVLGTDLPKQPRSSVAWGDIAILWLSVDQWLILCPQARVAELLSALRAALAGIHSLAVDVSDMRAVIRIEGEGAREVVMKGAAVDLGGGGFAPGTVKRLRFAEVAALLHAVEEAVFDLYVFRSYAAHAWNFLATAARRPAALRLYGRQEGV
jgi:sarcosine oxidase subunit gamma